MPFRFALESVLELRRALEARERLKLEVIASEQSQCCAQIDKLLGLSAATQRLIRERLAAGVAGFELEIEMRRRAQIAFAVKLARARLAEIERRRAAQLQAFTAIRRAREVLESLRLEQLDAYRASVSRREQQELDDLYLQRLRFRDSGPLA